MIKSFIFKITIPLLFILALVIWILWANKAVMLNKITIKSNKLPQSFDGFKIAHLSDIHNTDLGNGNIDVINILKTQKPDIIAITGDLLDTRRPGYDISIDLIKEASKIAPCYFVPGNHEAKSSQYIPLRSKLNSIGVEVVEDRKIQIERNGEYITLIGICDPLIKTQKLTGDSKTVTNKRLDNLNIDKNSYNVLLAHRPELFDIYAEHEIDLVLAGHAHGGQVRLPFIGGLYAPNQGLFPEYDSGLYTKNDTNMVVSRGLGKSVIPLRFNNRPEVIIIELTK
ncbi:MAG: metallophosphoesterase [Ruminococcaceae bacterium]|nr:metallophosphoesterase [Oscillospiraceae bacterium]